MELVGRSLAGETRRLIRLNPPRPLSDRLAMSRDERLALRTALARALRWAERTAVLAKEATASGPARESIRLALLATEHLTRSVEARQRVLLNSPERAPVRGE